MDETFINRLRNVAPEETHPDENLLSAFAENALPRRERESVAAHLAACPRCRECLALASSAAPPIERKAAPTGFPIPWWWGVAAAAAVCSVLAVIWFVHQPADRRADMEARSVAAVRPETAPPPSNEGENTVARQPNSARVHARKFVRPPAAAPAPTSVLDEQGRERDLVDGRDVARAPAAVNEPTQPVLGGIAGANANVPAAPPPPVRAAPAPRQDHFLRSDGVHLGTGTNVDTRVAKAKAAPAAMEMAQLVQPHWTVSAAGQLRRSLDNGATWQTIPIDPATTFRAVTASGTDVWAGGSGGALYHSTDSGANWQRIEVEADGTKLMDAITGINATRLPFLSVTTLVGQHWASFDAGQTWKRE